MKVEIRKGENGFICKWKDDLTDGSSKMEETLFEFKEPKVYDDHADKKSELEATKDMFQWLMDHFGIICNKYDVYSLDIEIKKREENE